MKKILSAGAVFFFLSAVPAYSHHMSVDYVDEEIYAMVDELVADTPHADLVLDWVGDMGAVDDKGNVITEETVEVVTISNATLRDVEYMIENGLLFYASKLDGAVTVSIDFNSEDGTLTVTLTQVE